MCSISGGILVASGLSSSGFVVFAIAGLLGAVMVALIRQKVSNTTVSGPADRTPVPGTQNA